MLPVTNPLDLWYLCQKASYAEKFPLRNSKGTPMYQRTVTQWIRMDGAFFNWHFPYYGEVGFDMTRSPPQAIMSMKEPDRPSRMPLSQYEYLVDNYSLLRKLHGQGSVGLMDLILTKQYLEDNLAPEDFERVNQMVEIARTNYIGEKKVTLDERIKGRRKIRGLLRIPDVIRVHDWSITGTARFAPGNLAFVIEMKFGEDRLSERQARDYLRIASGDKLKFRLLSTSVCKVESRRRREWLEKARNTEPVFKSVRVSGPPVTTRLMALQDSAAEWALLVYEIEQEHGKVRRILEPPPLPAGTPVMRAWDPAEDRRIQEQKRRGVASIELALNAPLAAAAAGTAVAGTILLAGGAGLGEGVTVVVTQTGKVIQFPAGRIAVGAAAANSAIYQAAAAPMPSDTPDVSREPYDFNAPHSLVYIEG
ncbi:hypothetical protein NU688_32690 [Variovorax sp. ZS18.2.2]|nr:hypothetical protein [Variovorax sp. ZS18.2.2]